MKKQYIYVFFLIISFSFNSYAVELENPVIDNSTGKEQYFEATDQELEYVDLDAKGNKNTFNGYAFDDSALWKAINTIKGDVEDIKSKILNLSKDSKKKVDYTGEVLVDKNGNIYKVGRDEDGNTYLVGEDGVKRRIYKDKNGRYIINNKGEKQYIDKMVSSKEDISNATSNNTNEVEQDSKKTSYYTSPNGKKYKIIEDKKGNKFVIDKNGNKKKIFKDKNGREYFINAKGEREYLDDGTITDSDTNESKKIFKDKNGLKNNKDEGYYDEEGNFIPYKNKRKGSPSDINYDDYTIGSIKKTDKLKLDSSTAADLMALIDLKKKMDKKKTRFNVSATNIEDKALPILAARIEESKKKVEEAKRAEEKPNQNIRIVATCDLKNRKDIVAPSEMMETYCYSYNIGSFILLSQLNTKLVNDIPTLIAKPVDITFEEKSYLNKNNYSITNSYVINKFTSNQNIATYVNMRRFERFLTKSGQDISELSKNGVDAFLNAQTESLSDESTTTNGTTGEQTVEKTTETPKFMDYLTPTGVQIAMTLIGNGIELIFTESPIMYTIEKNTKLKVYMTLIKDGILNEKEEKNEIATK